MKKIIIFLITLLFTININAFHPVHHISHPIHHSHVSHSRVSHHSTSHVSHISHPVHRTTPMMHTNNNHIIRNGLLFWLITRPHHYNDTYKINDKELKLCNKCHKVLIPKNWNICNKCRK